MALARTESSAACCSTFYEQDWVRALAGNVFHPGGTELSRRTIDGMELARGASLLDLGCGSGTSARVLAVERGLHIVGIDLSRSSLTQAMQDAGNLPIGFVQADAHRLPFLDDTFYALLGECVFSLFADKDAVLSGLRRVLRPDGRVGITDICVNGVLPAAFVETADWACLAGALSRTAYIELFERNGFEIVGAEDETQVLNTLIGQLKRKLVVVGASGLARGRMPFDVGTVNHWLDRFADEVDKGTVGYLRFQLKTGS
jgi:arsenite methyltransferase